MFKTFVFILLFNYRLGISTNNNVNIMSTGLNCPETLVGLDDDIDLTFLLPEFCDETDLYLGIDSELDKLFRSGPGCGSVEKPTEGSYSACGARPKKRTSMSKLTGSEGQVLWLTGPDPRKRTKRAQNCSSQSPVMGSLELLLSHSMTENFDHFPLTDDFQSAPF